MKEASATARDTTGRIAALVEPAVLAAGFDLEQVSVQRMGARSVVRVVVDRDGGVDLDAVAAATHAISPVLDGSDPLPGGYTLEVTSPGVDRPLTLPRHWRRAVGRLVSVRGPALSCTGRVLAADEEGVDMLVEGEPRRLAYAQVSKASVEVEFAPPPGGAER